MYLVHLSDNSIQNLSFERPENNCLVLNRIDNEALPRLDNSSADIINCCHSNNKSIPESSPKMNHEHM